MTAPALMIVGRVRKAHGIRGELVIEPITDTPDIVYATGHRLFAGTVTGEPATDGAQLTIRTVRSIASGGLIVRFDEIEGRDAAATWRHRYLLAPADELAPPAADEVYVHELFGMLVSLPTGELLGEVSEVYELPQGLTLAVRRGATDVLIPFRDEFIARVDRATRRIIATPPDGLFE